MRPKRTYSPSIDDVRQHNIKRQRLLADLESLSINNNNDSHHKPAYSRLQPVSTPTTEYIPDIDEFLLLNQDDRDVLESSKHILDLQHTNPEDLVIPEMLISRFSGLSKHDQRESYDRVLSRKRMGRSGGNVTLEEILYDHEVLKHWSLVVYRDPHMVVFEHWQQWSWSNNDDDLMAIDDDGGYEDIGEIDSLEINASSTPVKNTYGGYYENSSQYDETFHVRHQLHGDDDDDDDGVMDLD